MSGSIDNSIYYFTVDDSVVSRDVFSALWCSGILTLADTPPQRAYMFSEAGLCSAKEWPESWEPSTSALGIPLGSVQKRNVPLPEAFEHSQLAVQRGQLQLLRERPARQHEVKAGSRPSPLVINWQ